MFLSTVGKEHIVFVWRDNFYFYFEWIPTKYS